MEFGALEGPSISAKCDADEHFNMQTTTTFEMQQTFPDNTRVFGCVVEELFISDVDTWLSIDHCYFDICF